MKYTPKQEQSYEVEVTSYPKTYRVHATNEEEAKVKATKLANEDVKWSSMNRTIIK